jgi:translation initiation factor IF-2
MSDNKEQSKGDTLQISRPSKLSLTKTVDGGKVRQNFQHGRSKTVTVEVRKTRTFQKEGGKMVEVRSFGEEDDAKSASLTKSEQEARLKALKTAEEEKNTPKPEPLPKAAAKPAAESKVKAAAPADIPPEIPPVETKAAKAKLKTEEADKFEKKETKPPKMKLRRGESERRNSGKLTINQALSLNDERMRSMASIKRQREKVKKAALGETIASREQEKMVREVVVPEAITVQELANRMAERGADVVKALMKLGSMVTVNQTIDADTAELIVEEFGHKIKRVTDADVENVLIEEDDNEKDLKPRPPVVTIMGHVDHGKTSLLDALRKTDVVADEAGGITQHIGAYQVTVDTGDKVTFLDTPGHAAFTAMRARGAQTTDIVVLVVAADDGIMEQTKEAISHAKAAEVPIVVAINKVDKPEADPEKVKNELMSYELVPEDFGGDVQTLPVSAKTGEGLPALVESLLLQAEVNELKANPDRSASGVVVEARLDKGRGTVATLLVQRGTLKQGDIVVAGVSFGKIRAIIDDKNQMLKNAGPSQPVEILGLNEVPQAGDVFSVVENEKTAREITEYRDKKQRTLDTTIQPKSLDNLFSDSANEVRELSLIVKADVHGSAEAIQSSVVKLSDDEVTVKVSHLAVGPISESDVTLAQATGAIIVGFNVRASAQAKSMADKENVDIRYYSVIYDLVDDVKAALSGLLSPDLRENLLGYAEIREVFTMSKAGKVAGCMITEGMVKRGAKVRLLRDNVVIHEGTLKTLRRFKDDVKEVNSGYECGMAFEKYDDIRVGDFIEAFEVEEIARTVD